MLHKKEEPIIAHCHRNKNYCLAGLCGPLNRFFLDPLWHVKGGWTFGVHAGVMRCPLMGMSIKGGSTVHSAVLGSESRRGISMNWWFKISGVSTMHACDMHLCVCVYMRNVIDFLGSWSLVLSSGSHHDLKQNNKRIQNDYKLQYLNTLLRKWQWLIFTLSSCKQERKLREGKKNNAWLVFILSSM